ncbi:MAG: HAMP domain-containing protein, partial [Bradyrhizobium sp.]|uniref:HAMP domain-containing protein n=1 Tax=Bradyrhizobium sp. TaxID=376 RepID=UPI001A22CB99
MRFTVKAKLASAFGVVIALSMIAGAVGYIKLSEMIATADQLVSRSNRIERAAELKEGVLFLLRDEKNAILAATDAGYDEAAADLVKTREAVNKSKDEIYAAASEGGKKLIDRFSAAFGRMNAFQDETVRLARTDKAKALDRSMHEGRKLVEDALEGADGYIKSAKKNMADQAEQSKQDGVRAEMLLISLVIASLLIAVAAATWIAVNISRGLARAVGLANAVAVGDLSQKIAVSSNDELGDLVTSLNAMTANLNATADLANEIAQGNLTVEAKPLS